ncbi:2'-5' RNA ligase family protein [Capnocytophaga sputigena]|jgi:hypothetical protein|uniref:2'-5' RNA ligase family protein n=1 Tax=Capnocytophaga sputigena TaxID=1019 RepID=UPI000BB54598|nr:2'-5' RNA ligase family protein [Capnocytophaga sputigena]PBN46560.1 hypothetical protein CDC50_11240 [Capnocytophaga sputigena]
MKYFFIANFIDNEISSYLNAIKFIAEPTNFSIAHITLKGPFKTKQKKQFETIKKQLTNKEIKILEIGNFFEYNQNTVYLKCVEDPELYEIWKSKTDRTYKTYNPHITIYDGDDTAFSRKLYNTLKKYSIEHKLKIDEIDLYSKERKKEMFYKDILNTNLLSKVLKQDNCDTKHLSYVVENTAQENKINYIENIAKMFCKEV